MTTTTDLPGADPFAAANAQAHIVYRELEDNGARRTGTAYLRLEEAIAQIVSEAMLSIGAEDGNGDLDPAGLELFGDTRDLTGKVAQVVADHIYGSTLRYLESKAGASRLRLVRSDA